MSDRTSAEIFGRVFEVLAVYARAGKRPDPTVLASEIFVLVKDYDFSECQMDADDALRALYLLHGKGTAAVYGEAPSAPKGSRKVRHGPSREAEFEQEAAALDGINPRIGAP